MCPPIIGLVLTIAGSFATAMMQGQMAKQEAQIQQEQLKTEIENERIKGMSDTNNRLEEFRRQEASNRAALSANGLAENISYTQAIAPYNKSVAARDVRSIQFNAGQEISRKKYEISVEGWKAKARGRSALITAGAESLGAMGSYITGGSGGGGNAKYPG